MGQSSHKINIHQYQKSRKWPCDGKPRFGVGFKMNLTYDQAYEEILVVSGSERDEKTKKITFSREGLRRCIALNAIYYPSAKVFIYQHFVKLQQEQKALAEKARQEAEAATTAQPNAP